MTLKSNFFVSAVGMEDNLRDVNFTGIVVGEMMFANDRRKRLPQIATPCAHLWVLEEKY
jgi:hypothetical protein